MLLGLPWFAWIPIVAIIGGLITEHQKNKMKMMQMQRDSNQETDDLRKVIHNLKSRVENLEAIAAQSPEEMKNPVSVGEIEIKDEYDMSKDENRKTVSRMAGKS